MEKLHIYHINDIHSHFDNWPKIRRYLNQQKAFHENIGEDVLLFDIGDACDRVHPLTEATDGKANITLLNQIPFDAVTIGNNEGIGNAKHQLDSLYDEAHFPVVLANIIDPETNDIPTWAKPYLIKTLKSGLKVGIIGLTAPLYLSYVPNGWEPKESDEVLPKILLELVPQVDMIVLLSHVGIIEDIHLGEMYRSIPIIIGAHTHHVLPEGRMVDDSLLLGAGKWGQYIGHVTITLDAHVIMDRKAELIAAAELPGDPEDQTEIAALSTEGEKLLSEIKVADNPIALEADEQHANELVSLGLDAITEYAEIKLGILNSGLFLADLPAGIITKNHLHKILPHPMRLLECTLTGQHFKAMIDEMESQRVELMTKEISGMGFRGRIFGELCYRGFAVDPNTREITIDGKPIRDDEDITFVTVDHYRYISYFPTIENEGRSRLLFPYFLRDVVGLHLEKEFPILK
jgi:2',3'-cyclic-nucleotide 2'-phosphodiesterase (5'-nucleotidase family)